MTSSQATPTDKSLNSPPPKRRRIAAPNYTSTGPPAALSKPFKSPVKASFSSPHASEPVATGVKAVAVERLGAGDGDANANADGRPLLAVSASTTSTTASVLTKSTSTSTSPTTTTTTPTSKLKPKPQSHTQCQSKSHAADLIAVRALRADIDTLSQATRLLSITSDHTTTSTPAAPSPQRDEELRALIATWRRVSRAAAEEIYGVTRDRVNRMGGMEGLRDGERRAQERKREWEGRDAAGANEDEDEDESSDEDDDDEDEDDDNENKNKDGEGGGKSRHAKRHDDIEVREAKKAAKEMARERRREQRAEAKAEAEAAAASEYDAAAKRDMEAEADATAGRTARAGHGNENGSWSGGARGFNDDDAFTMDMMLRRLNVDLSVIGFDSEEQRWVD